MNTADKPKWVDNRTLVYTWLLIFFPVGLFAVWTGSLFDKQMRWKITGGVAVVLVLLIITNMVLLVARIILPAAGIYLCWKDPKIADRVTYMFAGGAFILLVVFVIDSAGTDSVPDAAPSPGPRTNPTGDGCGATITSGNCTYIRDSQCRVIGRVCE